MTKFELLSTEELSKPRRLWVKLSRIPTDRDVLLNPTDSLNPGGLFGGNSKPYSMPGDSMYSDPLTKSKELQNALEKLDPYRNSPLQD